MAISYLNCSVDSRHDALGRTVDKELERRYKFLAGPKSVHEVTERIGLMGHRLRGATWQSQVWPCVK